MMPMQRRRKTRKLEKVENLCRTATTQPPILPTRRYTTDHACAIPLDAGARSELPGAPGPALPEISHFGMEF
jgi:hypothetical protein